MSKETVQEIRFNGLAFIITGTDKHGPIATKKQYQNGECSYAHLYPDGRIVQFNKQIGTVEDIEFGEIVELEMDYEKALGGILYSDTWPF